MKTPLRSLQKQRLMSWGYITLLITLLLLTVAQENPETYIQWITSIGKALGTISLTMLVAQLVFSSRITFLERGVGLDTLMFWHKRNAKVLTLLVFSHPAFVYYIPLYQLGVSFTVALSSLQPGHYFGIIGLLLIASTVLFSIYSEKLKIPYHWWRLLHYSVYAIIIVGFMHGFMVSSNITAHTWVFWWWLFLLVVASTLTIYRFVIRPRQKAKEFTVTRIIQETPDAKSIYLKSSRSPLQHAPGQFSFVRFFSKGLPTEEHHFTLSSAPGEEELSFTIKELGDYTAQLDLVRAGDKALLDGPYGVFSNYALSGPFVFIAGGAGITPIMSMLRTMSKNNFEEKALLIYGNRTQTETIFLKELKQLAQDHQNFQLLLIYSAEEVPGSPHGFISHELIKNEVSNYHRATYFVCGPKPMTKIVKSSLISLDIHKDDIRIEIFSFK